MKNSYFGSYKTPLRTPLDERVARWIEMAPWELTRILLHPNARDDAKKLWPDGTVYGLPIEYVSER